MKYSSILILIFGFIANITAQTPPDGLEGAAFRTWLYDNYYVGKHTTLGYNTARGKMYGYIDNQNGKITCVYGGLQINRTYGNQSTNISPLNCEHTVPQSFFNNAEPMLSDIHHLFPAYETWNGYRGNYPFTEIEDNITQLWMISNTEQTTLPLNNIDGYSEYYAQLFEPREVHKGNVARAVAYFYTMYPTQAGVINWVLQPSLVCEWNALDTPDAAEQARNAAVFQYQGNRNPYIDHPEWIERAWCVPVATLSQHKSFEVSGISPNPAGGDAVFFTLNTTQSFMGGLTIYDALGKEILGQNLSLQGGENRVSVPISSLTNGFYTVSIKNKNGEQQSLKLVVGR